jgi:replication factor C large subunit
MWVEKYRPGKIADVIGNEEAKSLFVDWLRKKGGQKKAVLLYGPPGVGKTALAHAAASELGFTIVEMNASDARTEGLIKRIASPATSYLTLDQCSSKTQGNLLFLDEVDGIYAREERGGISAVIEVIEKSQVPVVLAANDIDLEKLRPLKKVCQLIRLREVRIPLIIALLRRICVAENIDAEFEALEKVAERSGGVVRSAINDLQTLAGKDRGIRLEDALRLSTRPRDLDMYETLKELFSAGSPEDALNALNRSNVDTDSLLLPMSDLLALQYEDPVELGAAYDLLSRADVVRGRIGVENWQLTRYFSNFLAQAASLPAKRSVHLEISSPPLKVLALFWTKSKRTMLEGICSKIAARCHVSRETAKMDFIPFLRIIFDKPGSKPLYTWLQLSTEETGFLAKMGKF